VVVAWPVATERLPVAAGSESPKLGCGAGRSAKRTLMSRWVRAEMIFDERSSCSSMSSRPAARCSPSLRSASSRSASPIRNSSVDTMQVSQTESPHGTTICRVGQPGPRSHGVRRRATTSRPYTCRRFLGLETDRPPTSRGRRSEWAHAFGSPHRRIVGSGLPRSVAGVSVVRR
jgi:hypothetical protein